MGCDDSALPRSWLPTSHLNRLLEDLISASQVSQQGVLCYLGFCLWPWSHWGSRGICPTGPHFHHLQSKHISRLLLLLLVQRQGLTWLRLNTLTLLFLFVISLVETFVQYKAWICYRAEDDLDLLILLPPPLGCWDYSHVHQTTAVFDDFWATHVTMHPKLFEDPIKYFL